MKKVKKNKMKNKEIAQKILDELIQFGNDIHFNQLFFKHFGEHFLEENENHKEISEFVYEQISVCNICGTISEYYFDDDLCDDCYVVEGEEENNEEENDEEYI